jgi:hypothetical protein
MIPLTLSNFTFQETLCLSHSVAIYDTRVRIAESIEYEKPKATNLLPMPAITPLSKKHAREMSNFDKHYQW